MLKRAIFAAVSLMIVMGLTGCDPDYDRHVPVDVSSNGTELHLAFCNNFEPDFLLVEYRATSRSDWQTLLKKSGKFKASLVVPMPQDEVVAAGSYVSVYASGGHNQKTGLYHFSSMTSTSWITSEGEVMATPCHR